MRKELLFDPTWSNVLHINTATFVWNGIQITFKHGAGLAFVSQSKILIVGNWTNQEFLLVQIYINFIWDVWCQKQGQV